MKSLKTLIYAAASLVAISTVSACSDWTDSEPEDYFVPPTQSYHDNLKDYFASPHKVMYGWFGNWSGATKQYSLCGLPDSVDFVSLWLCWGNLTEAQQADLAEFQKSGRKAILCWRAANIGDNLTPAGENRDQFWGVGTELEDRLEAARKYAKAIIDTCDKYNIDGFDLDMEDMGTLQDLSKPQVVNEFLRTLREDFTQKDRLLVVDIPAIFRGSTNWTFGSYYDLLEPETIEFVDYIVWQTYELDDCDGFFTLVKNRKPDSWETALSKSIITGTFEEASKEKYFEMQINFKSKYGEFAGMGAYHIEYDYPGTPDYPRVRKAITKMNPPIKE